MAAWSNVKSMVDTDSGGELRMLTGEHNNGEEFDEACPGGHPDG